MQLPQTRRGAVRHGGGRNGGFPEPPSGEPVQVVHCSHTACGSETRIRLPRALDPSAVHRVVCDGCSESFDTAASVDDPREPAAGAGAPAAAATVAAASGAGTSEPSAAARAIRALGETAEAGRDRIADAWWTLADRFDGGGARPSLPKVSRPDFSEGRIWTWASIPVAVLGVIAGLALIQGSDPAADPAPAGTAADGTGATTAGVAEAKFISKPGYSLALPPGWKRADPPDGASFKAEARNGEGEATLWIEEAPGLTLKQFERRSIAQLEAVAGEAEVVDRVQGPTPETSIVELSADAPVGNGFTSRYRVTLRAAGDFRHYFVTSTEPDASPGTLADVELMHGSLRPEVELADGVGG